MTNPCLNHNDRMTKQSTPNAFSHSNIDSLEFDSSFVILLSTSIFAKRFLYYWRLVRPNEPATRRHSATCLCSCFCSALPASLRPSCLFGPECSASFRHDPESIGGSYRPIQGDIYGQQTVCGEPRVFRR